MKREIGVKVTRKRERRHDGWMYGYIWMVDAKQIGSKGCVG